MLPLLLAACRPSPLPCQPASLQLHQELTADALLPSRADDASDRISYVGPGLALADIDGDGWLDLAVAPLLGGVVLFQGRGGELLPWETAALPPAQAIAAGDLDADGHTDLVLGRMEGEADLVLFGDGAGGFTQAPLPQSEGHTLTISLLDADLDGDLDLFTARSLSQLDPAQIAEGGATGGGNVLYINTGGQLSARDGAIPEQHVDDLTFIGAPIDADADGDLDLFLANDFGWYAEANILLESDGTGALSRAEDCGCETAMSAMGAAVGDVNGDGWPDLHITDLGSPDLLLSDGAGGFFDATLASGATLPLAQTRTASWGNTTIDIDQDGWPELAVTYGTINFWDPTGEAAVILPSGQEIADPLGQTDALLCNLGEGQFTDASAALGFDAADVGRAVVAGDLDRDGMPELVTAGWLDGQSPYVRIFQSTGGCGPGVTIATEAIGARVEVITPDRTMTHWVLPTTTFSSSAPEVYAGLGGWAEADVIVTLPGGEQLRWEAVPAGSLLRP